MRTIARSTAREAVERVLDPEVPVVTIADLGILRDVRVNEDGHVDVTITPTYSGCPAMDAIRQDIHAALADAGYDEVEVHTVLAPAWTTDWITEAGRGKLREYGIAPPSRGGIRARSASGWECGFPLMSPAHNADRHRHVRSVDSDRQHARRTMFATFVVSHSTISRRSEAHDQLSEADKKGTRGGGNRAISGRSPDHAKAGRLPPAEGCEPGSHHRRRGCDHL